MSLRSSFAGINLAALRVTFGSGDESLIEKVRAAATDPTSYLLATDSANEVAERQAAADVAERVIREGVPLPGVTAEGNPHVFAMLTLAETCQTLGPRTESDDVKGGAWDDLIDHADPLLPGDLRPLLRVLADGRPMLGTSIDTGWAFYGYLDRDELRRLRDGLEALLPRYDGQALIRAGADFVPELTEDTIEWFDEILDADRDLWLNAG